MARIAKQDLGCLTVGVVTKPFPFEGHQRQQQANRGLNWLAKEVDTLVVIPNERLLLVADPSMSMAAAFRMADEVLRQAMQSITELLLLPGEINLDFADLRTVMRDAGPAWMAIGKGNGIDRADAAILAALESPLLEVKINGASGVLLNITGGSDLMMAEVSKISETIKRQVHPDAEIIFGTTQDLRMENELKITIIATGFDQSDGIEHYERMRETRDEAAAAESTEIDPDLETDPGDIPDFLRPGERESLAVQTSRRYVADAHASDEGGEPEVQDEADDSDDTADESATESDAQVPGEESQAESVVADATGPDADSKVAQDASSSSDGDQSAAADDTTGKRAGNVGD